MIAKFLDPIRSFTRFDTSGRLHRKQFKFSYGIPSGVEDLSGGHAMEYVVVDAISVRLRAS